MYITIINIHITISYITNIIIYRYLQQIYYNLSSSVKTKEEFYIGLT